MRLPEVFYAEEFGPIIGGFIMINSFLLVFLFMPLGTRKLCAYALYMEASIIASVILWELYTILYAILIMGVFGFITYPSVWDWIEDKLGFKL